jgi:hypothetical protein
MKFDFAYLTASLILLGFWLLCFCFMKKERKALFWTAIIFAPAGPFSEFWHLQDYWHPPYLIDIKIGDWLFGIEDYITTFSLSGIAAGLFEYGFRKTDGPSLPVMTWKTFLKLHGWGLLGLALMLLFYNVAGMCSIHSILLTIVICSAIMLWSKRQMLKLLLPLSFLFGFMYWIFLVFIFMPLFPGVLPALWKLETTWGFMIAGVPVEEFLWGAAIMLFGGPVLRVNSKYT